MDGTRIAWSDFVFEENRRSHLVNDASLWNDEWLVRPVALLVAPGTLKPWIKHVAGALSYCGASAIGGQSYAVTLFAEHAPTLAHVQPNIPSIVIAGIAWRYQNGRDVGIRVVEAAQIAAF